MTDALVPLMVVGVVAWGLWKRAPVFDCFVEGAREGADSAVRLLPTLVGLLLAVNALRASGATELLAQAVAPLTARVGIPAEIMPLAFLRPLSGSGSLAMLRDTLDRCGADSYAGQVAAVLQGASETTFYVLTVYYGHMHITRSRHTLAACAVGDVSAVLLAALFVRLLCGG